MTEVLSKKRLLSLDVLRGITVAGMIVVNNAGGKLSYDTLRHSVWNGMTPCDMIFPFFLFIMGISTYIALRKFRFEPSAGVVRKILKRTLLILLIGIAIHWFGHVCSGDFMPFSHLRLTGVLQRIALCYCAVSFLSLYVPHRLFGWISGFILLAYGVFLLSANGYVPDETNVLCVIDRAVLGSAHLYAKSPIDPEGLFSTLPSIAHTMIGFCCGRMIMESDTLDKKITGLYVTGFILMAVGFLFTEALPLNKRIWSPTFALTTCGMAAMLQATLMYFIDLKGKRDWCSCFEVFGVNPLFLYVLSEVLAIVVGAIGIKPVVYDAIHSFVSNPYMASAVYSLIFAGLMAAAGYPLYKKKIYIKL